jgi:hypothetical protein
VLVADMLVQGQLSSADSLDSFALMRRNAERATASLSELRAQYAGATLPNEAETTLTT